MEKGSSYVQKDNATPNTDTGKDFAKLIDKFNMVKKFLILMKIKNNDKISYSKNNKSSDD